MSNQKIGTVEAIMMILAIVVSHTLLYLPKNILSFMKSASILNIIYVSIFAILIAYLIYRLLRNFPGLDIIDISEFVGGKLFKNIIGIIFILYFITSFSMFLRSFCESIKIIYYPMTNIFFILSFFIIAICIANRLDFNATLKTTLIILPIVLISVIFLFLTNLGQFTPQRMFPIFGEGIYNTFVLGLVNLYSFAGIEYIYFLPPFLKKPENMKKILLISIQKGRQLCVRRADLPQQPDGLLPPEGRRRGVRRSGLPCMGHGMGGRRAGLCHGAAAL